MHRDICRITTLTAIIAIVLDAAPAMTGEWDKFTTEDGLADNVVYSILEDSGGNLWFGTNGGASRFDGTWTTFTVADGLADNTVNAILEDTKGNLWFGTNGGASSYDGKRWTLYKAAEDGLGGNWVNSIVQDSVDNLWFGIGGDVRRGGGGVSRYDEIWTIFSKADTLADNEVWTSLKDSQGNLWFGTNEGVRLYDGEMWTEFTESNTDVGLADNVVNSILEDSEGNLWFGTKGGASRYDGTWTTYTISDGLADNWVSAILEDSKRNLWFGTKGGVTRYDGTWMSFTTEDGPADNWVKAILEDSKRNLWFGTERGVTRYDGTWMSFTTEDGLADNWVTSILEDREGGLWFGTNGGGVSRYDGERWRTFNVEDDLADNVVWTILEDNDGNLWFSGVGGTSRYRVDRTPPDTFISEGPDGTIGVGQVFFQYRGGDRFLPDEEVQYAYVTKKDGDKPARADWSSFSDITSTLTDPLPSGTYTFYVRTVDEVGNIDPSPAERTFTVDLTPPIVGISSPSSNEIIHGNVNIRGSAFDNSDVPDFTSYTLEYGSGSDEDKISEWLRIRDSAVKPVVNDLLGMWDTEGLFGTYVLRLRAVDGFDHRSKFAITIHVVAVAVEVDHSSGGHITDSASKVDLYIPPNSIPKSTQVTITRVALEGVAKPSALNLRLIGMAYDIGPKDLAVLKPATFTIFLNEDDIQDVPYLRKLAIFTRSSVDSPWERIGGTVDERTGRITVALTHFGRFALMEDLSADEGSLSISDVNCQPRVFSPKGGGYDTKTTISFNLGRGQRLQ